MLLNALFSSRVRVALLRLFLLNPDAPFHAQSLSAQIGARYSAVWKELVNLERAGIVVSEFVLTGLLSLLFLAACAPAYDQERAALATAASTWTATAAPTATVTATLAPTDTPTPTSTPTPKPTKTPLLPTATPEPTETPLLPTATPEPTETPIPTRSYAEQMAAHLPTFAGFSWRAAGDRIVLVDSKNPNNPVATLNSKSGALDWSAKYSAVINDSLKPDASPEQRDALVFFLQALKDQGIMFVNLPEPSQPPHLVRLSADNQLQDIVGKKGTARFVFDKKAQQVLGVFPDGSGYYWVNPDASFDLAPLEAQANQIAASLRQRGIIQHSDPEIAQRIEQAVVEAIKYYPYGVTPEEINEFIIARTGRDFAKHFDATWGNQVGVTYDQVMAAALAKSPKDQFKHIIKIYQSDNGKTFWQTTPEFSGVIGIQSDFLTDQPYYPLSVVLIKEANGSIAFFTAYHQAKNKERLFDNDDIGGRIGEAISFALDAYSAWYIQNINGNAWYDNNSGVGQGPGGVDGFIDSLIDSAFRGGYLMNETRRINQQITQIQAALSRTTSPNVRKDLQLQFVNLKQQLRQLNSYPII
jgi:hypothetical protein